MTRNETRHGIDWSLYGDQTIAPDRIITALCGMTVTSIDTSETPTCPRCRYAVVAS